MGDYPIFRGWDIIGRVWRGKKRFLSNIGKSYEAKQVDGLAVGVLENLQKLRLEDLAGRKAMAMDLAAHILERFAPDTHDPTGLPLFEPLANCAFYFIESDALFSLPDALKDDRVPDRSEIWEVEDQLRRMGKILDNFDNVFDELANLIGSAVHPLVEQYPSLIQPSISNASELSFKTELIDNITDLPEIIETMMQLPFAPELEKYDTTANLKARLEYNLNAASGGSPNNTAKTNKLPTKASPMPARQLVKSYLAGTPFEALFDCTVPLLFPDATRFEHHHIVAGSGHGKTQTLQHLILHDLEAVAAGKASIVVIDSQSDLINNIAGMSVFAPGGPLADRLVLIDPTDVEWPVALNLFDVGMDRINQYSQLDRERLINGILELYDFVLGSLLDAGMTQKQSVIFRYITRLLLHIPNATIHTFRELCWKMMALTNITSTSKC